MLADPVFFRALHPPPFGSETVSPGETSFTRGFLICEPDETVDSELIVDEPFSRNPFFFFILPLPLVAELYKLANRPGTDSRVHASFVNLSKERGRSEGGTQREFRGQGYFLVVVIHWYLQTNSFK